MSRPAPVNNRWFDDSDADSVFVFVHGFLSNSASCWEYSGGRGAESMTWPRLVRGDPRLKSPAIFLGGYTTNVDSNTLRIADAARELRLGLTAPSGSGLRAPLTKPNILFICHSLGGVVTRYLIERYREDFKDKILGLYLVASPSIGSRVASYAGGLLDFYNLQLGLQLQANSAALEDLDDRFSDLVYDEDIPGLVGVEAYEHHLFAPRAQWWRWLHPLFPRRLRVVEKESASRYFGAGHLLPDTDHFSTVKPNDLNHPAHRVLFDFFLHQFQPLAGGSPTPAVANPVAVPTTLAVPSPVPSPERKKTMQHLYSMREYFNTLSTIGYRIKSLVFENRYSANHALVQKVTLTIGAIDQPLAAITAIRSVDAPVDDLADLKFRVSTSDAKTRLFWCPVEDEPTARRFVILIHPAIQPNGELTLVIHNQWPDGGHNLRQRDQWDVSEYTPPAQLAGPIESLMFQINVPDDGKQYSVRYDGNERQVSQECEWACQLADVKSGQIVSVQTAWTA